MPRDARTPNRRRAAVLLLAIVSVWPLQAWSDEPLALVDDIDLVRYQGLWYEIALLPNRFQERCVAETTAEYALKENGRIRVVNRCRTAGGDYDRVVGEARRPDPERPAALEVRFAPKWLGWLAFVWGDYQVMAVDDEYRWAMVGAPSREFLWILGREPSLPDARIEALLAEAGAQGFDVDDVVRSPQP